MSFNCKIGKNGSYRKFYGWTIISNIKYDLKFIENFISNNRVLSLYFSALPSSSYHMTIYNLWSNGSKLLEVQKKVIDMETNPVKKEKLMRNSRSVGYFNPNNCMNKLFYDIHSVCKFHGWNSVKLTVKEVLFTGNTIRIVLREADNNPIINNLRNKLEELCQRQDKMSQYHITLAYKYKNLTENDLHKIKKEIEVLNILIFGQTVELAPPNLYSFSDMKSFNPYIPSS